MPAPFSCLLVFAHTARKLGPPDRQQTSIHLKQSIAEAKLKTAHLVRYGSVFLTPTQLGRFANCTFHLGPETIFCEGICSIAPLQLGGRNAISKIAQCANCHMNNAALPQWPLAKSNHQMLSSDIIFCKTCSCWKCDKVKKHEVRYILITRWHSWMAGLMNSPGKHTGVGCHALLQGSSQLRDRTWVSCISCIALQLSHLEGPTHMEHNIHTHNQLVELKVFLSFFFK